MAGALHSGQVVRDRLRALSAALAKAFKRLSERAKACSLLAKFFAQLTTSFGCSMDRIDYRSMYLMVL